MAWEVGYVYGHDQLGCRSRSQHARFADIAYVKIRQGWLCLALMMDIWSRRIVGWSMGPNITAELADDALKMTLARRNPPDGCVRHSDHGSQYVSLLLSKTMRENGVRP